MPLNESMIPTRGEKPTVSRHVPAEQVPLLLDRSHIEELPKKPGVYRFYDAEDNLIYVGKSINIKQRVLSHFSARNRDHKELKLALQTRAVRFQVCAGDLGAQLLENQLIKQLQPVYNKAQRKLKNLVSIQIEKNGEFLIPRFNSQPIDQVRWSQDCYGIFKNRKAAQAFLIKSAPDSDLCLKRLGLEAGNGACFAYQLKKCSGACVDESLAQAHNASLMNTLKQVRILAWPFHGPVVIREPATIGSREDWHLIHNWCYLGSASSAVEAAQLQENPTQFDMDSYRILARYHQQKLLEFLAI